MAQKQHNYIGSDTWRFFKNKVKNYFIKDCNRNILIILTDGYLYHKNNVRKEGNKTTYLTRIPSKINGNDWKNIMKKKGYGFISANDKLNDLEVLVIGIVNYDKKNPYGEDIIKEYWGNWLKNMGIKHFEIIPADLPINVEKVIKEFITS